MININYYNRYINSYEIDFPPENICLKFIIQIPNSDLKALFSSKIWLLNQYSTPKSVCEIKIPLHILGLISTADLDLILAQGGAVPPCP